VAVLWGEKEGGGGGGKGRVTGEGGMSVSVTASVQYLDKGSNPLGGGGGIRYTSNRSVLEHATILP
jgi:hypothetical protein